MTQYSKASLRTLCGLQFPTTLHELGQEIYPGIPHEQCKSRVRAHVTSLRGIITTKNKPVLSKKGRREIKKLIGKYIDSDNILHEIKIPDAAQMLKPIDENKYQLVMQKLNKDIYFDDEMHKFLADIDNELDLAFNKRPPELDRIPIIVTKIFNAKGAQLGALDEKFLDGANDLMKKHVVSSRTKVYQIDPDKLFKLFVKINKLSTIQKKINTVEFKHFLVDWLIRRMRKTTFTRRNVMKTIESQLREYQNDYEMGSFLWSRFQIETKVYRIVDYVRTLNPNIFKIT